MPLFMLINRAERTKLIDIASVRDFGTKGDLGAGATVAVTVDTKA